MSVTTVPAVTTIASFPTGSDRGQAAGMLAQGTAGGSGSAIAPIRAPAIVHARRIGWASEADPQAILAHLDLGQARCAELGDERGQQLRDRAGDRSPVGAPLVGRQARLAGLAFGRFRHGLDPL